MNERIHSSDSKAIKRFLNLDNNAYQNGALPIKIKSRDELIEILSITNLVVGSICIPHTWRALEYWDALHTS